METKLKKLSELSDYIDDEFGEKIKALISVYENYFDYLSDNTKAAIENELSDDLSFIETNFEFVERKEISEYFIKTLEQRT